MKKMVLVQSNNTKVKFLDMKMFNYSKPVIGQPFYITELNGSNALRTSRVVDVKEDLNLLGLGTITIKTKNSEYKFRTFGY